MNTIDTIFDLMDSWRHLPDYQLERRADLFFSLYLPQAIEKKLGFPVEPRFIPEFPVRKGIIYEDIPKKEVNQSNKIDYVAIAKHGKIAVFVELKTDVSSHRGVQGEYFELARDAGFPTLLAGILDIFRNPRSAKRKYFCLIDQLAKLGQYRIPEDVHEIMTRQRLQGITKASYGMKVTSKVSECIIVYVEPTRTKSCSITFDEFRDVVSAYDDEVSKRFAKSLAEWARVEAGRCEQIGG